MPKRCSPRCTFSVITSKQMPHVLSFERATANECSISFSIIVMHSCNARIKNVGDYSQFLGFALFFIFFHFFFIFFFKFFQLYFEILVSIFFVLKNNSFPFELRNLGIQWHFPAHHFPASANFKTREIFYWNTKNCLKILKITNFGNPANAINWTYNAEICYKNAKHKTEMCSVS